MLYCTRALIVIIMFLKNYKARRFLLALKNAQDACRECIAEKQRSATLKGICSRFSSN